MNAVRAHKIRLVPNAAQAALLARSAGTARFAYNWALAEWRRQYADGQRPNEAALRRLLNEVKPDCFGWMAEVTKNAPQQAIKNLGDAYKRFFGKAGRSPRFKKKGGRDSFRADNGPGTFACDGRGIRLPKIGWVRMREELRFDGRPLSVTVSRDGDRWYAAVSVEMAHDPPDRSADPVGGIDVGVTTLATESDGTKHAPTKAANRYARKLRRAQRTLSRRQRGSNRRAKAKRAVANVHRKIRDARTDRLHKVCTAVVRKYGTLGIEKLNVAGMVKNRGLAKAVSGAGLSEFLRQIRYKADLYGTRIVEAGRFFPSSKTCSGCGAVAAAMPLSVRQWACSGCGEVHDRDVNAAINLRTLAASSAERINARGEAGSGVAASAAA